MPRLNWGVLDKNKPHSLFVEWRNHMVPFEVLDMLIAADLGDVPQIEITEQQFEKAMEKASR